MGRWVKSKLIACCIFCFTTSDNYAMLSQLLSSPAHLLALLFEYQNNSSDFFFEIFKLHVAQIKHADRFSTTCC